MIILNPLNNLTQWGREKTLKRDDQEETLFVSCIFWKIARERKLVHDLLDRTRGCVSKRLRSSSPSISFCDLF